MYAWGNLWRLPFTAPDASGTRRSGLFTLVLYGAVVVVFSVVTIALEVLVGDPLLNAVTPGVSHSLLDALWHLATGVALALPARRWVTLWMAPALALGLDVDHIFGGLLPTVTERTAHDVFLLAAVGVVLYLVQGRSAGFLAAGGVLAHLAVDGGSFPLLGPVTTSTFPLPPAVSVGLLVLASTLFYLAGREPRELLKPLPLVTMAGVVAIVAAVFLGLPALMTFISQ